MDPIRPTSHHRYVKAKDGLIDREIFADRAIYDLELERIFARSWNFMCHESQIPKPGDYFLSFIGEESVICTRDRAGVLRVFLNSCRHRGNAVCRSESGSARSFMCTYHGWTYGLDGKLVGIPGEKDFYHGELDREKWGLIQAPKVKSYKGFVFANMDPDAPDLEDYLGDVGRLGMDMIAEQGEDLVLVDGVQKNVIRCNWKMAVDNLFDFYHVPLTHASATMSGFLRTAPPPNPKADGSAPEPPRPAPAGGFRLRVMMGDYGHAITGPIMTPEFHAMIAAAGDHVPPMADERWRSRPQAREALGSAGYDLRGHPNIFPNLWVSASGTQLSLRLPRGPDATEIWWFTFVDRKLSPERKAVRVGLGVGTFGPGGMLEQDDGENWAQSTRAARTTLARRYPLNYQMNLGRGQPITEADGQVHIDGSLNEYSQLWTLRSWADWMDAETWAALKANRSPIPAEAV
jgi:phenylpropionate dioxygenase-like ring-hydroxylating dioxygenase large terminal subunit